MKKGVNIIRFFICTIAFGVFCWYEYRLYTKYMNEKKIREKVIEVNTENIEKSFLIRKEGFYRDSEYLKRFETLKKQEKEEENSSDGGEDTIEQVTDI